jgi:hypothetical protein
MKEVLKMISNEQLKGLRELEKSASGSPWKRGGTGFIVCVTGDSLNGNEAIISQRSDNEKTIPDADLIAAAPAPSPIDRD